MQCNKYNDDRFNWRIVVPVTGIIEELACVNEKKGGYEGDGCLGNESHIGLTYELIQIHDTVTHY